MKKLFFAVAGLAAVALAACGPTYDVAQPLDNWKSDKGSVGEELQVTAGETLTAQGDYRNFELKGQAPVWEDSNMIQASDPQHIIKLHQWTMLPQQFGFEP